MRRLALLSTLLTVTLLVSGCNLTDRFLPPVGDLQIVLEGLPPSAKAGVIVRGPDSFEQTIDFETTLTDIEAGAYTVVATTVEEGGTSYTPDEEVTRVQVDANDVTKVTIVYTTP